MSPSRIFDPSFPFRPANSRLYYGWIIAVAGTVGIICSIPGQTMGVSVFTDHLVENLSMSRTNLSVSYMLGTICSGFLVTWMGRWLDRNGLREGTVVSALGMGVALVFLSQVDRIAAVFYGESSGVLEVVAKFSVVTSGFFLLRFFGQGLMTLASRNMIAKWFDLYRGRVTAISGIAASFAFSSAPWGLERMIQSFGWRGAWLVLAGVSGLFLLVFAYVLFRDNPEECGLEVDAGRRAKDGARVNRDNLVVRDFTRGEAIRTYSFWVYNLAISLQGFFITGYTFHLTSIADDLGVGQDVLLQAFLPGAVIGVAVSAGVGWLIDWTRMKYSLWIFCVGLLLVPLGLLLAPDPLGVGVVILGFGVAGGSFAPILGTVWARFYGRKELGGISGFNMSSIVLASALGPTFFSLSFDHLGGYRPAIGFGVACALGLIVAGYFAENPQRALQNKGSKK